jgi:4-alpha-glucanotransferase
VSLESLNLLATSYGLETSFYDDGGRFYQATPEALLAVLRVLGASIGHVEDANDALRALRQERWGRLVEPVHVAWDGNWGELSLRLRVADVSTPLECLLRTEEGQEYAWKANPASFPVFDRADVEGVAYLRCGLPLTGPVPLGYHRLTVAQPGRAATTCQVLAAPTRAYAPLHQEKTWGLFLPTYAIRSARDWGAGDLTDLANLIGDVQRRGGGLVGTLPLLASFLGEGGEGAPFEPSPYAPASRLFWNEFFLDVGRVLREEGRPEVPTDAGFVRERDELRKLSLVDYRRVMALKRRYLFDLFTDLLEGSWARRAAFESFVAAHPRVRDYARFRAVTEARAASWHTWPEAQRDGLLGDQDGDPKVVRYHEIVQWLADGQLRSLAEKAGTSGPGLYLDLPLGVHSDSYDVWRERASFAIGVSGGAPPDTFFTKGQEWGFPPLQPEGIRADGYGYLRRCLHHHMQYAGMLRIDHVMGLHRLYWVPKGLGPLHGVYVRYPADELYAVYCLESVRHQTILVGEDLGTVPDSVRPAMGRHDVHRLYVGQFELRNDSNQPIMPPAPGAVASMNTHDLPTFAGFWRCLDLEDGRNLGLYDDGSVRHEAYRRRQQLGLLLEWLRRVGLLQGNSDEANVLRACLTFLAGGPASAILVSAEDLWQAPDPQNVPGTWRERPNWRRRAAVALEHFDDLPELVATLWALNEAVRRK